MFHRSTRVHPDLLLVAALATALGIAIAPLTARAHSDSASDGLIEGGGNSKTDCVAKFQTGLELNYPASKTKKKELACVDGDASCDTDGLANGSCSFAVGLCFADDDDMLSTGCVPAGVSSGGVAVKNKASAPDPDLVALQNAADAMLGTGIACDNPGSPPGNCFQCTASQVDVTASLAVKKGRKRIKVKTTTDPGGIKNKPIKDSDKLKLRCLACESDSAWEHINKIVFQGSCATATVCHTGANPAGGLNLDSADIGLAGVYDELVSESPFSVGAAALGMSRVLPGDPDLEGDSSSLLIEKLRRTVGELDALCADGGQSAGCLGTSMPPSTDTFSPGKLELLKAWIAADAPQTGWPAGTTCGEPEDIWTPAEPLDPPPPGEGFQIYLPPPDDFEVAPGTEFEGCQWLQVPPEVSQSTYVDRIEIRANIGTHHIIIFDDVPDSGPPAQPTAFDANDTACNKRFGIKAMLTTSQDPTSDQSLPAGVGFEVLPGETYGMNIHYTNPFNVPIYPEMWVNFYGTTTPTPKTTSQILPGDLAFSVAPFTTGLSNLTSYRHASNAAAPACFWQVTTHQHRRGIGAKIWESQPSSFNDPTGLLLYNVDWDHPTRLQPEPRIMLEPGERFWFQCEWDNGVLSDVTRRCDDCSVLNPNVCFSDDDCASGNCVACPLDFGFLSEDEMCFIPAYSYPADFDSGSGQWVCNY
jgi:hypothetical protein